MNAIAPEPQILRQLTAWFTDRLDQADLHWEDEPLSYDGNTQYDVLFYRLQTEAAQYWQSHYGYVPTPGQLMKGFFGAEFERSQRRRMSALNWRQRIRDWCARSRRHCGGGARFFSLRRAQ
jgi:hypothetical protein